MNILDNELIRRYFGCDEDIICHGKGADCKNLAVSHILQAMQDPIRIGDRFLWLGPEDEITEHERAFGVWGHSDDFHPYVLRLPDKFQKKTCCEFYEDRPELRQYACAKRKFQERKCAPCCQCREKDGVEEKIKELVTGWGTNYGLEDHLRELVRLVEENK